MNTLNFVKYQFVCAGDKYGVKECPRATFYNNVTRKQEDFVYYSI